MPARSSSSSVQCRKMRLRPKTPPKRRFTLKSPKSLSTATKWPRAWRCRRTWRAGRLAPLGSARTREAPSSEPESRRQSTLKSVRASTWTRLRRPPPPGPGSEREASQQKRPSGRPATSAKKRSRVAGGRSAHSLDAVVVNATSTGPETSRSKGVRVLTRPAPADSAHGNAISAKGTPPKPACPRGTWCKLTSAGLCSAAMPSEGHSATTRGSPALLRHATSSEPPTAGARSAAAAASGRAGRIARSRVAKSVGMRPLPRATPQRPRKTQRAPTFASACAAAKWPPSMRLRAA
mmetsp:Transcript_133773/g.416079  ORF Transcript_133773/g.416079 Transcript_133773/m.416079 type:complete len:293 (-) Transcript_133773:822-1700(-)